MVLVIWYLDLRDALLVSAGAALFPVEVGDPALLASLARGQLVPLGVSSGEGRV